MSILYTPAGDTDPIRGFRDGGILHIIRHYHPKMVRIFLSADMVQKEEKAKFYSEPIRRIAKDIDIEFIKTEITDVHHMEALLPLMEGFYRLRNEYPQEQIILNLSSGTPQMKTIMSFLATDCENVIAVQVDSPERGSNRNNHANTSKDDIDAIIDTNEDNEPDAPNRCYTPQLTLFKRYSVRHELISLVSSYEYSAAWGLYKKNRHMFDASVGKLLEHADLRSKLLSKEASKMYGKHEKTSALYEYLMIMEINQRKGQLVEFVVKLTPFLYELAKFYFDNRLSLKIRDFCTQKDNRKAWLISSSKLKQAAPAAFDALNYRFNGLRDGQELSFLNMLCIMETLPDASSELVKLFSALRIIEAKHRNHVAHTIRDITEELLRNSEPYLSSSEIILHLRKAFAIVMADEKILKANVYDEINKKIVQQLDEIGNGLL